MHQLTLGQQGADALGLPENQQQFNSQILK